MDTPKKVLFMRGYFPPESAASNQMCLDLIKRLGQKGMKVTVACPVPTRGVTDEVRREYKKNKKKEELFKNVTIKRYSLPREGNNSLIRAGRYFLQNIYQFFYGLRADYDVLFLYSTPPTNGLVGGLLAKLRKKSFYYYLHDIFPDSLVQAGKTKKGSFLWKVGRAVEKFTYKNSREILVLSRTMRENIIAKGVPEEKVGIIPNWVNTKYIQRVEREDNTLITEYGINPDKFIVTYAGNIGKAQSVETLIEAARLLEDEKEIEFVIIGDGVEKERCVKIAGDDKNIMFIPMQPPERISEVYSLGDVSTILCRKGVGSAGMPSKTGSIFATEKMVIAAFDEGSDLHRILEENEIGLCVEPENPREFADAILWAKNNPEAVELMEKRSVKFLNEYMTSEICTERIYEFINK